MPSVSSFRIHIEVFNRYLFRVVLFSVALLLMQSVSFAQQGTLTDNATFPTGFTALTVQGDSAAGGPAVSFVKFKLSPNLPSGTPGSFVAKASLTLYVGGFNTAGSFNVYRVTSNWSQSDLAAPTYDTANPLATGLAITTAGSYVTVDLTALTQQWLGTDGLGTGGVPNFGIALVANTSTTAFSFDSKESTQTSHPAGLAIVLNHATGADIANNFSGPLAGDVTGTQSATVVSSVGGQSAANVASGTNAANAATSLNTPNTIVKRDAAGNISAPQISGNLTLSSGNLGIGTASPNNKLQVAGLVDFNDTNANSFVGSSAGNSSNDTGQHNVAVGYYALSSNTNGNYNVAVGSYALRSNLGVRPPGNLYSDDGGFNTAVGYSAMQSNTTGSVNTAIGAAALNSNTTGHHNLAIGVESLENNITGGLNTAVGPYDVMYSNTTGSNNVALGYAALYNNTTANGNTALGVSASYQNTTGASNTAVGNSAMNSNTTGNSNTAVGDSAGYYLTSGNRNIFIGQSAGVNLISGSGNIVIGSNINTPQPNSSASLNIGNLIFGQGLNGVGSTISSGNIGIGTITPQDRLDVNGVIRVGTLGKGGSTQLCRNASNQIASCSSSLRYKTQIAPFSAGLDIINRLRPISFTWLDHPERDFGLGAEDVAAIEPLLVTRNARGQVEGVKYDRVSIVLVNAIKEQQEQIKQQQSEIESLKKLVCQDHPRASACKITRR